MEEGKEGLERERGGDRKATDREEFRFPRFSNVGTPWEAKRGRLRHRLRGMDAPACGS
jgi:hypothetical protein